MKLIMLCAVLLAGVSFMSFAADNLSDDGPNSASSMCSAIPLLCDHSLLIAYAAVGLAGLCLLIKIISLSRN